MGRGGVSPAFREEGVDCDEFWAWVEERAVRGDRLELPYLHAIINLPPAPESAVTAILDKLRIARRAAEALPLAMLASAMLKSHPGTDTARISLVLLGVEQKFKSIHAPWRHILFALPLTEGTRDLWWEVALYVVERSDGKVVRAVQEIVLAHRMATGNATPHLYEPSPLLVGRHRGGIPESTLLLFAPARGSQVYKEKAIEARSGRDAVGGGLKVAV